jgi:DNA-binding transcriptional MerR regulator
MYGLMRIGEVSRRLRVSREHLRALERAGRIPTARRLEGDRVYDAVDLRLLQEIGVGARPNRLKSLDEVQGGRVER